MDKPIYALHRDRDSKVLAAADFTHSYQLNDWFRGLDIRAGDKIEFNEVMQRGTDEAEFTPAFLEPTPPPAPAPAAADDDQPF